MSSGADLFVVCKQCGSEVSPYITECPYCGNRLRRRAPKLPREHDPRRCPAPGSRLPVPSLGQTSPGGDRGGARGVAALRHDRADRGQLRGVGIDERRLSGPRQADRRGAAAERLVEAPHRPVRLRERVLPGRLRVLGARGGGVFGWLLERRHGPARGARRVLRRRRHGRAGGARGLSDTRWSAAPTPARSGCSRRGPCPTSGPPGGGATTTATCSGTAAIAAVLLAMPFARWEASWLAGVTGGGPRARAGLRLQQHPHEDRLRVACPPAERQNPRRGGAPQAPGSASTYPYPNKTNDRERG